MFYSKIAALFTLVVLASLVVTPSCKTTEGIGPALVDLKDKTVAPRMAGHGAMEMAVDPAAVILYRHYLSVRHEKQRLKRHRPGGGFGGTPRVPGRL